MKPKPDCNPSRRQFLSDCATAAPVLVVAATPAVAVATPDAGATHERQDDKGYRLTQHVVDYYKSATA